MARRSPSHSYSISKSSSFQLASGHWGKVQGSSLLPHFNLLRRRRFRAMVTLVKATGHAVRAVCHTLPVCPKASCTTMTIFSEHVMTMTNNLKTTRPKNGKHQAMNKSKCWQFVQSMLRLVRTAIFAHGCIELSAQLKALGQLLQWKPSLYLLTKS